MSEKQNQLATNNLEVVELSAKETEKIAGGASLKSAVMLDSSQKLNINLGTKLQTWEAGLIKDFDLVSNDCQTGTCTAEDNTCDCD